MKEQDQGSEFRVACLGDSHTRGTHGYDWLGQLNREYQGSGVRLGNFGVNGELAYGARRRVPEVLASRPDLVMVLIGTNDVNARVSPSLTSRYVEKGGLPQSPDKAFFVEHLRGIVTDIRSASKARVALATLPVLGELPESDANRMVSDYNQEIVGLSAEAGTHLIDLNEAMRLDLEKAGMKERRGHYDGRWLMHRSLFKRYLLRRGWDAIGESYGYRLLADGIHMNERGGRILAEQARRCLELAKNDRLKEASIR